MSIYPPPSDLTPIYNPNEFPSSDDPLFTNIFLKKAGDTASGLIAFNLGLLSNNNIINSAGSFSAPSYTFIGHTTTGMYYDNSTPLIGVSIAGDTALTISSSGLSIPVNRSITMGTSSIENEYSFLDLTQTAVPLNSWGVMVWIDSLNKYILAGNNATGLFENIQQSTDGLIWTDIYDLSTSLSFESVAYSPVANRIVALAGNSSQLAYSDNGGVNWTIGALPSGTWRTCIYDNGLFMAVSVTSGITNKTMYSSTGLPGSWTLVNAPFTAAWSSIIWVQDDSQYVLIGSTTSADCVGLSPDGTSWSGVSAIANGNFTGIAYSPVLSRYVCIGLNGIAQYSDDGALTWSSSSSGLSGADLYSIKYISSYDLFFAAGTAVYAYSYNGIDWVELSFPDPAFFVFYSGLAYSPTLDQIAMSSLTGPISRVNTINTTNGLAFDVEGNKKMSINYNNITFDEDVVFNNAVQFTNIELATNGKINNGLNDQIQFGSGSIDLQIGGVSKVLVDTVGATVNNKLVLSSGDFTSVGGTSNDGAITTTGTSDLHIKSGDTIYMYAENPADQTDIIVLGSQGGVRDGTNSTAISMNSFDNTTNSTGQILVRDKQDATRPSYSFFGGGQNTTGMYLSSNNNLGFCTEGVNRAIINSTSATFAPVIRAPAGSVTVPSLSFSGDTNTGLYSSTGDELSITAGGTRRAYVNSTSTFVDKLTASGLDTQVRIIDTGAGNKQWNLEVDNGFFSIEENSNSTNWIRIADGGTIILGASAVANPSTDTNGIYRFGSRSFFNRNHIITLTGIRTITYTINLGSNNASSHTSSAFLMRINGNQTNSGRTGLTIYEGSVRKIVNSSASTWNVITSRYDTSSLADASQVEFTPLSGLTDQIICVVTTPDILVANYTVSVDFELSGYNYITSFTSVVA